MKLSSYILLILLVCILCSGCQINVVVAPDATFAVDSDLSNNLVAPTHVYESGELPCFGDTCNE